MLEHLNFRALLQRWLLLQLFLLEYFTLAVSQIFTRLMPNKWYPISTTDAVVLTHNWYIYIQGSLEFCNSNTLFTGNITCSRTARDWHRAGAATLLYREDISNCLELAETSKFLGPWKIRSPAVKVKRPHQKPVCSQKQEAWEFATQGAHPLPAELITVQEMEVTGTPQHCTNSYVCNLLLSLTSSAS